MKHYTCTEIKTLNEFSVGGNLNNPDSCFLTLYNEDDNGIESDTVEIHLPQKRLESLIKCLIYYQKHFENIEKESNNACK